MQMILGTAYPCDGLPSKAGALGAMPVCKQWRHLENSGRDILLEATEYTSLKALLQQLPEPSVAASQVPRQGTLDRLLPPAPKASDVSVPIDITDAPYAERGLVLDFIIVVSQASYTFQSGITYRV